MMESAIYQAVNCSDPIKVFDLCASHFFIIFPIASFMTLSHYVPRNIVEYLQHSMDRSMLRSDVAP